MIQLFNDKGNYHITTKHYVKIPHCVNNAEFMVREKEPTFYTKI